MAAQQKFRYYRLQKRLLLSLDWFSVFAISAPELRGSYTNGYCSQRLPTSRLHTQAATTTLINQSQRLLKKACVAVGLGMAYLRRQAMLQRGVNYAAMSSNTTSDRQLSKPSRIPPKIYLLPSCHVLTGLQDHGFEQKSPNSRLYSRYNGEHELPRLGGKIFYIPNYINWLLNKWNLASLRRNYDPGFNEKEFLEVAKQAVVYVLHMTSLKNFDALKGVVTYDVIDWLRTFMSVRCLSEPERQALAIDQRDILVIRIDRLTVDEKGKALAFVNTECYAAKEGGNRPFLVDLNMRFRRDYSEYPTSTWIVDKIDYIRLRNLD